MNRRMPVQVGPWVPSPGSSTEERLSYKQEVRGSTPRSGTVVVVYRLCTRDCGSRGPGSTPGSHPTGARRRWRVGPACKAGALLRGFESLGSHPCPRSSADRAPGSEPEGREFESRRGYARPHVRVVKELVCKTRHRRFDSGCGLVRHPLWLSQAGAGCPSAPHKGGAPGSTPGPATDGRGRVLPGSAGTNSEGPTTEDCTSRCEGEPLLRLVRISL